MTRPAVAPVETLRKYRDEIGDVDALTGAALYLADGVTLTGNAEDMADADEAIDIARRLLSIARRQLQYLAAELDDQIGPDDTDADTDTAPATEQPA